MKSKNRRTIKIIVGILVVLVVCTGIFLYVAIFRGFYASSDIPAGEYTGSANVEFLGGKEIYRVVANKYGEPIFENPSGAFDEAITDYGDAIHLIYETFGTEYGLNTFNNENYQMYMVLGWQLPTDNETIRKQGSDLTKFLDIYENSEKRWYLTPVGWVREAT